MSFFFLVSRLRFHLVSAPSSPSSMILLIPGGIPSKLILHALAKSPGKNSSSPLSYFSLSVTIFKEDWCCIYFVCVCVLRLILYL